MFVKCFAVKLRTKAFIMFSWLAKKKNKKLHLKFMNIICHLAGCSSLATILDLFTLRCIYYQYTSYLPLIRLKAIQGPLPSLAPRGNWTTPEDTQTASFPGQYHGRKSGKDPAYIRCSSMLELLSPPKNDLKVWEFKNIKLRKTGVSKLSRGSMTRGYFAKVKQFQDISTNVIPHSDS